MERKTFTELELEEMHKKRSKRVGCGWSKEELITKAGLGIPGNTIDYALPHPWVKYMTEKFDTTYAKICGTTVMVYNEENRHGIPMSYCAEIQAILDKELMQP